MSFSYMLYNYMCAHYLYCPVIGHESVRFAHSSVIHSIAPTFSTSFIRYGQ